MRIANFAFKMAVHIAFSHNSATDQYKTAQFVSQYVDGFLHKFNV